MDGQYAYKLMGAPAKNGHANPRGSGKRRGGSGAPRMGFNPRSQTRRVFLCWLYAIEVNDAEQCETGWICKTLGIEEKRLKLDFLDKLKEKYIEKQKLMDNYLEKFLVKEYPTLDQMCSTILKSMLVEKALDPDLPMAVSVDETVNMAHEFASEGYKVVNALAEKLWKQPDLPTILANRGAGDGSGDSGAQT